MSDTLEKPAGSPSSGNAQWYYALSDERLGPFSARELKALAEAGDIAPETLVWKHGFKDWVPARKIKNLFSSEARNAAVVLEALAGLSHGTAMKACPFCAEDINANARKCRHCGELIPTGSQIACPSCRRVFPPGTKLCVACGYDFRSGQRHAVAQTRSTPSGYVGARVRQSGASMGGKSKLAAVLLALFLGGLGAHKFYLGSHLMGVLYLLFCWTLIPGFIAFIEAIVYATMSEESFAEKYG